MIIIRWLGGRSSCVGRIIVDAGSDDSSIVSGRSLQEPNRDLGWYLATVAC